MSVEDLRLPTALTGRFEPLGVIGVGGFGEVFRARQVGLGRLVAVKVLHAQYLHDPQLRARFASEAQVVSRISHPNVVPVLDFGLDDDAAYIIFPFVDGGSLRARMDRGPVPWLETVPILSAMLEALAYIHSEGIVHRDLKPENVMLEGGTTAMLTDFGISKPAGSTFHTGQGVVIGTPGYLPPEVVTGEPASAQTDIFAVGVIAWEMLCGVRPFESEADGDAASARAIIAELQRAKEGPPHAYPPGAEGLPPDLDRFFDKLLSPRSKERFSKASDAIQALVAIAEGHEQTRAKMKRPTRSRPSTGGRTLVVSSIPRARPTLVSVATGAGPHPGRAAAMALAALVAAAIVGGGIRYASRDDRGTAAHLLTAATAAAPPPVPAPSAPHRDEIQRLAIKLEGDPIAVRPWIGRHGPGDYDCPLIIADRARLKSVGLQALPGCHLVSVNGSIVNDRPGDRVEVDAARFQQGLNWVVISCNDAVPRAATAWLDLAPGSPPPPPPPLVKELFDYDELRCVLTEASDPVPAANAYLERTIARDEPLMLEVGRALVELNSEAVWNRRFEAATPGLLTLAEDPYWVEGDTLQLASKMLKTVQRAIERYPARQVLWSNLGWVLRRSKQPDAGRIALVEALRLYPEAHWSWLELAQLERKLGEADSAGLMSPQELLEHAKSSADYYDWAGRFFGTAGAGHTPKAWSTFVKWVARRRAQLPGVVAQARDLVTKSTKAQ